MLTALIILTIIGAVCYWCSCRTKRPANSSALYTANPSAHWTAKNNGGIGSAW